MAHHFWNERLEQARDALRRHDPRGVESPAAGAPQIAIRRDGMQPVAFLATVSLDADPVLRVLPLREGVNPVGRRASASTYVGAGDERTMESHQWFIVCRDRHARAIDAASTNLSVLVPRESSHRIIDEPRAFGLAGYEELPGARILEHWNTLVGVGATGVDVEAAAQRHGLAVEEGDLLRGIYATFVFGWV